MSYLLSMIFTHTDFPEPVTLAFFDNADKSKAAIIHRDVAGSGTLSVSVPNDWTDCHLSIRASSYFIPNSYRAINPSLDLSMTGAEFFLDIDAGDRQNELNSVSVEQLIHSVISSTGLDSRQKFYIGLMSMNSYCEYLTHTILVKSGHLSNAAFRNLNHQDAITASFSSFNTDFFQNRITLCPGKEVDLPSVDQVARDSLAEIMQDVRVLRNKVAHSWGFKSTDQRIHDFCVKYNTPILVSPNPDEDLLNAGAQAILNLYARLNPIRQHVLLFIERKYIQDDQRSRGF